MGQYSKQNSLGWGNIADSDWKKTARIFTLTATQTVKK
jgi:hypothetical protein